MGRGGVRSNPSGTQVIPCLNTARCPPHPCQKCRDGPAWRGGGALCPLPCALPEPCVPGVEKVPWAPAVASGSSVPTQGGAWGPAYEEPPAGPGDCPGARGLRGVGQSGLQSPGLDGTYRRWGLARKKLWRPLSGSVGPLGGDGSPASGPAGHGPPSTSLSLPSSACLLSSGRVGGEAQATAALRGTDSLPLRRGDGCPL